MRTAYEHMCVRMYMHLHGHEQIGTEVSVYTCIYIHIFLYVQSRMYIHAIYRCASIHTNDTIQLEHDSPPTRKPREEGQPD